MILLYLGEILRNKPKVWNDRAIPMLGPSVSAEKETGAVAISRSIRNFFNLQSFARKILIAKNTCEERTILLRSAGRHEEALKYTFMIFVIRCSAIMRRSIYDAMKKAKASERIEGKDIYMKLMRTCLLVMRRTHL